MISDRTFFESPNKIALLPMPSSIELKLGRQASGYKTAQKALDKMIAELKFLVDSL